jgi:hypothetical protein
MSEIKIKLDDNKDLIVALEKRTKLLEKLLKNKDKGLKAGDVARIMAKSRRQESKSINRTISSLASAITKIKPPKISISQKDNTSVITKSLNERRALLEKLLKEVRKPQKQTVKIVRTGSPKLKVIENTTNVILDSINNKLRGGMSVVPSPS